MVTMLTQQNIDSSLLGESYPIWVLSAPNQNESRVCLFLDAEIYLQRMEIEQWVKEWNETTDLPNISALFLSHIDQEHRHRDFICNEHYAQFLVVELIPWLRGRGLLGDQSPVLVGLSLSGLAAIHAAWRHPHAFSGIVAQSPSAWWNDEWLTREIKTKQSNMPKTWLSVGSEETDEDVFHPPTETHQKTSQIESCRRLANRLTSNAAGFHLHEYEGGHDPVCWRDELDAAFRWLLETS